MSKLLNLTQKWTQIIQPGKDASDQIQCAALQKMVIEFQMFLFFRHVSKCDNTQDKNEQCIADPKQVFHCLHLWVCIRIELKCTPMPLLSFSKHAHFP